MFSLQSDFLRHSLINLLGPAELRMFVHLLPKCPSYSLHHPVDCPVLKQSSGPTLSGSLEEQQRYRVTLLGNPRGCVPLVAGRFKESEKGRQRAVVK
ncbi:hypothetical protein ES703_60281 [subsurface metagenome]|nr:hypothetical protein [bacterium]